MGWSFACDRQHGRRNEIREVTNPAFWSHTLVDHSTVGNNVWVLLEDAAGTRVIALVLLKSGGRDGGWGRKVIGETDGPAYYDCPMRLIRAASEPKNEYSAKWREQVAEHHAVKRQRAKLRPGDAVTVYGNPYTLVGKSTTGKRGWIVRRENDGMEFLATRHVMPA